MPSAGTHALSRYGQPVYSRCVGRHSADPRAADGTPDPALEHHDDDGRRFVAGPTTDPLLLDARAEEQPVRDGRRWADPSTPVRQVPPRTGQVHRTPASTRVRDAPSAARPAPPAGPATARPARTRDVPDPPWAPRPVVRYDDAPFSGPVALPDPPEPGLTTRTEIVEVQHPDTPSTLPALLDEPRRPAAATVAAAPDLEPSSDDADGDQERIGLSVRTLLLSLAVGVGVTVVLSVVAVLPI